MTRTNGRSQYELLAGLKEEDVLEHGSLFLFSDKEPLAWRCVEIKPLPTPEGPMRRYTFQLLYREILLREVIVVLDDELRKVVWLTSLPEDRHEASAV